MDHRSVHRGERDPSGVRWPTALEQTHATSGSDEAAFVHTSHTPHHHRPFFFSSSERSPNARGVHSRALRGRVRPSFAARMRGWGASDRLNANSAARAFGIRSEKEKKEKVRWWSGVWSV